MGMSLWIFPPISGVCANWKTKREEREENRTQNKNKGKKRCRRNTESVEKMETNRVETNTTKYATRVHTVPKIPSSMEEIITYSLEPVPEETRKPKDCIQDPNLWITISDVVVSNQRFSAKLTLMNSTSPPNRLVFPFIHLQLALKIKGAKWVRSPRLYYVTEDDTELQLEIKFSCTGPLPSPYPHGVGKNVTEFDVELPVAHAIPDGDITVKNKMRVHYTHSTVCTLATTGKTIF